MEISEVVELYNKMHNFFIFMFLVVILPSTYFIFVSIPRSILSRYYPTVEGEVISGEVARSHLNQKGNKYDKDVMGYVFSTHIKYRYFVDGKTYFSKKINWHRVDSSNYNSHSKTVKKYPKGKRVNVYYNPAKPQIAVLEPGLSLETFFWLFFCVLSIAFVIFFIIKSY